MASLVVNRGPHIMDFFNNKKETLDNLNYELYLALKYLRPTEETRNIIDIYVELLFPSMKRHRYEVCWGCQHDHPGQVQHDVCHMISTRKYLTCYIKDALAFIPNMEVNRIAKNRANGTYGPLIDIPMTETEWKKEWSHIVIVKLLKLFFFPT